MVDPLQTGSLEAREKKNAAVLSQECRFCCFFFPTGNKERRADESECQLCPAGGGSLSLPKLAKDTQSTQTQMQFILCSALDTWLSRAHSQQSVWGTNSSPSLHCAF